jgi:hypothetical protein
VHTARQLDTEQFAITIDGASASPEELFPGWDARDRFGVVVHQKLGGVGASLLLQLAVAMFYATSQNRPGRVYPEVYVFHVGGWHGSHAWYDVFPPRKEAVVPDDAAAILDAVNDRAITRLAVVDGPVERVRHHHQEPAAALERVVSAFAYAPGGRTANADVQLAAQDLGAVENTQIILHPDATRELQQRLASTLPPVRDDEDLVYPRREPTSRAVREAASCRRDEISDSGLPVETYRRVPVQSALGMLHVRSAVPKVARANVAGDGR